MVTDFQIEDTHLRRIERVQDYILRHIQEPLDREILAEVAEYSVPHFHRVFTACTGESAVTYVRRLRLSRAGQKLRMGAIDIMEIALAAGYESHAAFSKALTSELLPCLNSPITTTLLVFDASVPRTDCRRVVRSGRS